MKEEREYESVEQFADRVGVSKWTIYEAVKRKEIPGAFRICRRIRIHVPTAMAWIKGSGCESDSQQ